MTEIQCKCKICKSNAATLGLTLPLRAEVPAGNPVVAALLKTASGRHGLVHMAHDPNAVTGAAARANTGVRAVV